MSALSALPGTHHASTGRSNQHSIAPAIGTGPLGAALTLSAGAVAAQLPADDAYRRSTDCAVALPLPHKLLPLSNLTATSAALTGPGCFRPSWSRPARAAA